MDGAAGRLPTEEKTPLPVDATGNGDLPLQKKNGLLSSETESGNAEAFHGRRDVSQNVADDNARAEIPIPLNRFLYLAERQSRLEPPAKRMKFCPANAKGSVMKHVADIVLALAGLGLIRGGKDATPEERRLQAEAYGHLGFLVQGLCPRELVPQAAIDRLIEDLGLCKPEGQEVRTFEQILKESQPPASNQMVDSGRVGTDALATGSSLEDSDTQKHLLAASRSHQGGTGSSEEQQSQRHREGEALPSEHGGDASGSHAEYMKAIYDLLQPKYPPDYAFQEAHSRDFMSATMPCEICKVAVREIVNVLVCDNCENVFHLQCLQSYLMTGIPKGDWHCATCKVSKERTQGPKYGRVKAGFSFADASGPRKTSAKASSHVPMTRQAVSSVDGEVNMEVVKNVTSAAIQKLDNQAPDSNTTSQKAVNHGGLGGSFTALSDNFSQEDGHADSKIGNAVQVANREQSAHSQVQTTTRSIFLRSHVGQSPRMFPSKPHPHASKGAMGAAKAAQKDMQSKKSSDLPATAGRLGNGEKPLNSVDDGKSFDEPSVGSREVKEGEKLVKETDRYGVEWVGDVLHMVDGKRFYSACIVGNNFYRLHDCALFRPETPNIPPYIARLQALWEETSSCEKWVRVNWCYYPADMAMLPGRPSNPEVHEVYESNHGDNNLVGTIQGQCLVLPPENYAKEMNRRQELLKSGNSKEGLVPVFLCRWLYDVESATFRPKSVAL